MAEARYVRRLELSSADVVAELQEGRRVIIEVSVLGTQLRMAIRERNGTYYCDTPIKLMTFKSSDELMACLERYRLATASESTTGGKEKEEDVR